MEKITRAAFLFMTPKIRDLGRTFAQCGPCRMFVEKMSNCIAHGSYVTVDADDSCGWFLDWPTIDGKPNPHVVEDHARELRKGITGSVTPEESGLVHDRVQCHRCIFPEQNGYICGLYDRLNKEEPDIWDLDINITPHSCCNAWTKK